MNIYFSLIFKTRTIPDKIRVTKFAIITTASLISKPYINHNNTPIKKIKYIYKEMPEVSFVLMIFNTCGRKLIEVQKAAQ
jgi:hypothetical protein